MFIAAMPEAEPTGYRADVVKWLRNSCYRGALLRNWGAESLDGFAIATGLDLDKLKTIGTRSLRTISAVWLEERIYNELGHPSSLNAYMVAMHKRYGI